MDVTQPASRVSQDGSAIPAPSERIAHQSQHQVDQRAASKDKLLTLRNTSRESASESIADSASRNKSQHSINVAESALPVGADISNSEVIAPVASDDPEKGNNAGHAKDGDGNMGAPSLGNFLQLLRRRTQRSQIAETAWAMPAARVNTPESYPHGYPRLAAHIDSETNTHLYRRFGYLRTRALLYAQDELVCLERKLQTMDEADAAEVPYRLYERLFDVEDDPRRQVLFTEINSKLKDYDELLLRQRDVLALRQASHRDWLYHARYLWGKKPLCPEDMEFVWCEDDMVDLFTYTESTWMRPMIETFVSLLPRRLLTFIFRKKQKNNPEGDESIDSTTQSLVDGRLEIVFKIIIVLMTVILLLVPVALLYLLTVNAWWKLAIVFTFIAIFTTVTLFMTQAKRNEVFVSVATYTAVLVVFLGNLPSPTISPGGGP